MALSPVGNFVHVSVLVSIDFLSNSEGNAPYNAKVMTILVLIAMVFVTILEMNRGRISLNLVLVVLLQGLIQTLFLSIASTKKCDHDCDQAFMKSLLWGSVWYTYINELTFWLYGVTFPDLKWVKIPSLAAVQVAKYMRAVNWCACAFKE